ncbi:hypothetical protein [Pseudobdellovibrio exovorus]|uniref:Uncharacterized protein n=1 Tax=Pseudobdellovibrio exovorus JSS TaxID=1184267 RepID=M4VSQ8_9BACT|nr:hypothetical protein [Pseudobdellovibrio exovorus]AGH96244.1 hypothetical protein A11Q_2028 [Pseudobdellovibrio exovorus JSS]
MKAKQVFKLGLVGIGILTSGVWARAENHVLKTFLWSAEYSDSQPLSVSLLTKAASLDCQQYESYRSQHPEASAEDVDFARRLPLSGQMKSEYEVNFSAEFNHASSTSQRSLQQESQKDFQTLFEIPFRLQHPAIAIKVSDFKNLKVLQTEFESLSYRSQMLGLNADKVTLHSPSDGIESDYVVRIYERDTACDLLAGRITLKGEAFYQISPRQADILKMNSWTQDVLTQLKQVISLELDQRQQAALLGLRFTARVPQIVEPEKMDGYLESIFRVLFIEGSFQLQDHIQSFSGDGFINYPKSVTTASPHSVVFKAKKEGVMRVSSSQTAELVRSDDERLYAIENEINSLSNLNYEEMTDEQIKRFNTLNRQRIEIIKQKIWSQYGRYL